MNNDFLEEIAKFLVGNDRDCLIANVKLLKKVELLPEMPEKNWREKVVKKSQLNKIILINRKTKN